MVNGGAVEASAHNACTGTTSDAVHGHINDFLVCTGLRRGAGEGQLPCFTAVRAEITVLLPLRTTPSVAEQEGQQTETVATGTPQKHHHTLNQ